MTRNAGVWLVFLYWLGCMCPTLPHTSFCRWGHTVLPFTLGRCGSNNFEMDVEATFGTRHQFRLSCLMLTRLNKICLL